MKPLLGIALVLALGFVTSRRWFGRLKTWGRSRFFYLTGEEFLLVGWLLGPSATNLLDPGVLAGLEPFVGLGLGYLGFVFGMQFDRRGLRQVPGRFVAASLLQSTVVWAALAAGLAWTLSRWMPVQPALVAALAATGVGTSTSFLYLVDRATRWGRDPAFRFLRFASVFDDLWGVLAFGLALAALHGLGPAWALTTLAVAGLSAGILLSALRLSLDRREEMLVLLGAVLFTGGLAAYLKVSPVLANALGGFAFRNLAPDGGRYLDRLLPVEKPIYLFMLVVAGAWWSFAEAGVLLVAAVYVACRAAGKWAGGAAAAGVLGRAGHGGAMGWGLLAQSEMSVALMVNLFVLYPNPATRLGASAVFLAVLVNDLWSSVHFHRVYGRT